MHLYRVTFDGEREVGLYRAETARKALDAMARESYGYADFALMLNRQGADIRKSYKATRVAA